jgi:neutral trehalase
MYYWDNFIEMKGALRSGTSEWINSYCRFSRS